MCPVCKGRGEVEAGITKGTIEFGPVLMGKDWKGRDYPTRSAYPTKIVPNPTALYSNKEVWFLDTNPLCELWGIAVCARCRGTGMGE